MFIGVLDICCQQLYAGPNLRPTKFLGPNLLQQNFYGAQYAGAQFAAEKRSGPNLPRTIIHASNKQTQEDLCNCKQAFLLQNNCMFHYKNCTAIIALHIVLQHFH